MGNEYYAPVATSRALSSDWAAVNPLAAPSPAPPEPAELTTGGRDDGSKQQLKPTMVTSPAENGSDWASAQRPGPATSVASPPALMPLEEDSLPQAPSQPQALVYPPGYPPMQMVATSQPQGHGPDTATHVDLSAAPNYNSQGAIYASPGSGEAAVAALAAAAKGPPTFASRVEAVATRVLSWIPVVFVAFLIAWSLVAFLIQVGAMMSSGPGGSMGLRVAAGILGTTLAALAAFSYYQVIRTDPGSPVPLTARDESFESSATARSLGIAGIGVELQQRGGPPQQSGSAEAHVSVLDQDVEAAPLPLTVTVKHDGSIRFCRKCDLPKPDRAHHCRQCNRCILKMDHHCPWVNNCVGFRNYKAFLLFLFYTALYSLIVFFFTIPYFGATMRLDANNDFSQATQVLALMLSSFLFGACLSAFCGYHVHLVLRNRTTIEAMEKQRYVPGAAERVRNPFNLGWRRNWTQVMGPTPLLWLVPVMNSVGDGMSFPTNMQLRLSTEPAPHRNAVQSEYAIRHA